MMRARRFGPEGCWKVKPISELCFNIVKKRHSPYDRGIGLRSADVPPVYPDGAPRRRRLSPARGRSGGLGEPPRGCGLKLGRGRVVVGRRGVGGRGADGYAVEGPHTGRNRRRGGGAGGAGSRGKWLQGAGFKKARSLRSRKFKILYKSVLVLKCFFKKFSKSQDLAYQCPSCGGRQPRRAVGAIDSVCSHGRQQRGRGSSGLRLRHRRNRSVQHQLGVGGHHQVEVSLPPQH